MKSKFSVDDYSHYVFTPKHLTSWVLGLLRYDVSETNDGSSDELIHVWAYQAKRLFSDRLVGKESVDKFDGMLVSTARNDWSVALDKLNSGYFVTWGATGGQSLTGNVFGSFGRPLGVLSDEDFKQIVSKGLTAYG